MVSQWGKRDDQDDGIVFHGFIVGVAFSAVFWLVVAWLLCGHMFVSQ